jgi:hypothetical protein
MSAYKVIAKEVTSGGHGRLIDSGALTPQVGLR